MTLRQWAEYGWLRGHATSRQEISDLLAIVDRDIARTLTKSTSS